MRKTIDQIYPFTFVLLIAFVILVITETTYTKKGVITSVNDYKIQITDEGGFIWEVEGDNFKVGDHVVLTMDTNHTDDTIKDDIVKKIKKIKENT